MLTPVFFKLVPKPQVCHFFFRQKYPEMPIFFLKIFVIIELEITDDILKKRPNFSK
jgi:hypothetical protein